MEYPDRLGLYYQPKMLIGAFDILLIIYNREEEEKKKKHGEINS
jgi:hypothetical protein